MIAVKIYKDGVHYDTPRGEIEYGTTEEAL